MLSLLHLILNHKKFRSAIHKGKGGLGLYKRDPDISPRYLLLPIARSLRPWPSIKSVFVADRTSRHRPGEVSFTPTSSPWDLLPVEIQIKIFAQCSVRDLLPLRLVCRAFYEILTVHEQLIARQYLRDRRHGTLPSPIDKERTYTRNPEDDVVLLSDLFPPLRSARGGHLYTFRYLHSLRRRQKLCSRLCYYLADRVMDRFMHSETTFIKTNFPSKSERNAFFKRGVASVWFNLTPLMYCALFFLESYAEARREHTNSLLRDFEAGRLPVPIPLHVRRDMYRALQAKILQSPPFTDTSTLISTHHCMQLLVSYLRHTMPPDEPVFDDSWIGSLLTMSPFSRIVEFFSAEIGDGGNQRAQRRDFMHNFHNDLMRHERDERNPLIFDFGTDTNGHYHSIGIRDIWFDVAREELSARRAVPHDIESIWVWNGVPILFGCQDCRNRAGWRA
ncbi:F-box domain protein [Thermoascus aurantiacus ATCC 26904]